jgi:hypothetical protein
VRVFSEIVFKPRINANKRQYFSFALIRGATATLVKMSSTFLIKPFNLQEMKNVANHQS